LNGTILAPLNEPYLGTKMAPNQSPLDVGMASILYINIGGYLMVWCVNTLKIVGEGKVEKSSLCNFEIDLGYIDNFLIVNKELGEIIKVIVFPEKQFEKIFFEEDVTNCNLHFIKFKEGSPTWINEKDIRLIAREYHKRSGKRLLVLHNVAT
jgi:hypothetical protein